MKVLGTKFTFSFLVVLVTFLNCLLVILKHVSRQNPTPYMDELFHIPQAQKFCRYEFNKWDRKITTLPGLYLLSISIIKPLEWIMGLTLCSVYGLRFVNVLGTVANFILCYAIQKKLRPSKVVLCTVVMTIAVDVRLVLGEKVHVPRLHLQFILSSFLALGEKGEPSFVDVISSLNVALFPPLLFFTFLYYTDVWSTAFVLLMYNLHLSKFYLPAAMAGFSATLMRQTNIIWVGFVMLDAAWAVLGVKNKVSSIQEAINVVRRRINYKLVKTVIWTIIPYLAVCSFFVAFVIVNGGVVVGDRKAHIAVAHPMQNLYFLDFAFFFAIPYAVFEIKNIKGWIKRLPLICTIWIFFASLSEYNLIEHPYLLADNRHLAFYVWKRTFGHRQLRRLLTPTYVISGLGLITLLRKADIMFLITLAFCIIANLTPQHLFEVRYFIIPFILIRLQFVQRTAVVLLESFYFLLINALVFYVFFTKEIVWSSEPGTVQRIIW